MDVTSGVRPILAAARCSQDRQTTLYGPKFSGLVDVLELYELPFTVTSYDEEALPE